MPQLQNVVLTDRAATPVNRTFVPRDISQDGVGTTVNSSGSPIGEERCTVSMKRKGARFQGQVRLVLPIVQTETINGVGRPVVVRTAYVNLDVTFDEKSTLQERKDAIGMIQSALDPSKTLVNNALINLEGVY